MGKNYFQGISDQEKAGKHRIADAEALFIQKRWRGSMYLAGYAVECLLKAKLMRMFNCQRLDDLEDELRRRGLTRENQTTRTHSLAILMRCTGAMERLQRDRKSLLIFNAVNEWVPAWRYNPDLSKYKTAYDFNTAVRTMLRWIENSI